MNEYEYNNKILEDASSSLNTYYKSNINKYGNYPLESNNNFKYKYLVSSIHSTLKKSFDFDKIAGKGSTLEKSLNVMHWICKHTYYCGYSNLGPSKSLEILDRSYDKGFEGAINCVNKSILLSDCLLALGIFALPVYITNHVMSGKKIGYGTSHVVVHVYVKEIEKWIMLDPSFDAYLTDANNEIMNVIEIKNAYNNKQQINLGNYSFNGNKQLFKNIYIDSFIINNLFEVSVCESSLSNSEYGASCYTLFPVNVDFESYLKTLLSLEELGKKQKEVIEKMLKDIKYISVKELLAKPISIEITENKGNI